MRNIEKTFTYPIWDSWGENTAECTGTHTYKGPEFLTLKSQTINDPDYGKESVGVYMKKAELERPKVYNNYCRL